MEARKLKLHDIDKDATTSSGTGCDNPCGANCCDADAICLNDGNGNLSCAASCVTSGDCPNSDSCCAELDGGGAVCAPDTGDYWCLCDTGIECSTGACAPGVDANGYPAGPYVCSADDGGYYNGCNAVSCVEDGTCCMGDLKGNYFCALPCESESDCPGDATCNGYDNSQTICFDDFACGPP